MFDPAFDQLSHSSASPEVLHATVVEVGAGGVFGVLARDGRMIDARASPGCLPRPEPGDAVAVCPMDDGRNNRIFAVLDRAEGRPAYLGFDRGVRILAGGSLSLIADRDLRIRSRRFRSFANKLAANVGGMAHRIGNLRATLKHFRYFAEIAHCASARVTQRLGAYRRDSLEHEERHAASSRHMVETDLTAKSGRTDIVAEKIVKCDGRLVQLG